MPPSSRWLVADTVLIRGAGSRSRRTLWTNQPPLCQAVLVCVANGLGAVAGAGLVEDPVDVGLDCGAAEEQRVCDLGVRLPGGDQLEHLDLAWREFVREVGPRRWCRGGGWRWRGLIEDGGHESLLHGWVEVGLARDERPDRVFDFFRGCVLRKVAARAGLQGWEEELVVGVGCQHQHACVGERGEDLAGRLGALPGGALPGSPHASAGPRGGGGG